MTDQNAQHETDSAEPDQAQQAQPPATNGAQRPIRPCPYCGRLGENDGVQEQCALCKGWFEPLSRQASQNSMGPWFFHDEVVPFRPGCSYDTLRKLIAKQRVTGDTLIRGPGSNQFWVFARHCPGVAHLLGVCHNCARQASADAFCCDHCGAAFPTYDDRQMLGLAPVRLLPGQADPNSVAASAMSSAQVDDPLPRMKIDPDDSNYGPLAPTFATAAVEAATAHAESGTRPTDLRSPTEETIDELPEPTPASRRDRKQAQMKTTIGFLIAVTVVLLIAVVALLLRTPQGSAAAAAEPAPPSIDHAATASQPEPQVIAQTVWTERLDRADELIATDDLQQMESALAILREVQADAPAADRPADLDARITALADRIENEQLRNFLNKND